MIVAMSVDIKTITRRSEVKAELAIKGFCERHVRYDKIEAIYGMDA